MFCEFFTDELARRIGSRVEVATDNNLIEGVLSTVTDEVVLVIDITSGYGQNNKLYVAADAINFVTFPQVA